MLCDFKVMQLGGIHRIQLADVFGTAPPSNHNARSPSTSVTDRASRMRLPLGRTWATSAMTRAVKESSLEFTFGFVPVLNGAGDGGQSLGLGVVRTELFVQQTRKLGHWLIPAFRSRAAGWRVRRALAATVFTDQHFNQIVFVEGSRFVLAWSVRPLAGGWCPMDHGRSLFARALVLRHQDALARWATHRE